MTTSEARISAVVGTAFTLMILTEIFSEYSPNKMGFFFLLLLWVPMLIVHELGHALVAKLLGWSVREIVIGFGRDLWQWQIGETRIKIKLAPVEGYVLPAPTEPRHVRPKSMLIYAAGPGAEFLVLGVILIVFGSGKVFNESDEISLIALQSLAYVIIIGAGFNLLPFRTEGAVSDGLGIISSPFMSSESIELRLLTFELREIQKMMATGKTGQAVESLKVQLHRFPENASLQLLLGSALSADNQDDRARDFVREKLDTQNLSDGQRRAWLHLQAQVELDAKDPSFLTLDLALQKALEITPNAPDLKATKGASLVLRGQSEDGGNMLAHAWRRLTGCGNDASVLAYLTIAAHHYGDQTASEHFKQAFEQTNQSVALQLRVDKSTRQARRSL